MSQMDKRLILFLFLVFASGEKLVYKAKFDDLELRNEKIENWVLLAAGSNTYDNYRHQADVCHAYHVVRSKGVPTKNIIVMMYDDIANDPMNPHPGKLFNHPHGPDVYQGVPIDYRTKDVTPENFLAVLAGDEEKMRGVGSGRVIKSTSKDHIFLNMVDHGAPGIFCFPDTQLHAADLLKVMKEMHAKDMYAQMVVYLESCESGSIFQGLLPSNISVYATTAANAGESSFACYWDDVINAYLGDVYSVMWMADSEEEDSTLETLHKQFLVVKKDTNTSHVCQFGDEKMAREAVEDFQGSSSSSFSSSSSSFSSKLLKQHKPLPHAPLNAVASEEVPLATLYRRLDGVYESSSQAASIKAQIRKLIKERNDVEIVMRKITRETANKTRLQHHLLTSPTPPLTRHQCYKALTQAFDKSCFSISQSGYARKQLNVLLNMCEGGVHEDVSIQIINNVCQSSGL